jgi:hypothetical protein
MTGIEIQPVVFEGVSHFVEDDEADFRVAQVAAGNFPGRLRRLGIALLVLGFPGEAFATDMPGDIGLLTEKGFFAGVRTAFDELDNADLEAVAEGAGDHAESEEDLPLPLPVLITSTPRSS